MISKVIACIVIILIVFIGLSVYLQAPYSQTSIQPITVYYKTALKTITHFPTSLSYYPSPNWTVTDLDLTIDNAFSNSNIHFVLNYVNVTDVNQFFHLNGDGTGFINPNEESEYVRNNPPDMAITYPLIQNGHYFFYRDIIELLDGTYAKITPCSSFLKQTSFDTWEGKIVLENIGLINETGRPYSSVNVQKLTLNMEIPNNYDIQNIENMNAVPDSSGVKITQNLNAEQTFDLVIMNKNLQSIQSYAIIIFQDIGIPSTIVGIFILKIYNKKKSKKRHRRLK